MKTIRIDFTKINPLVDGFIVGRIGEHNATKLLITPPAEMQKNGDISFYYVAFETGGKVYHSDRIEKADAIEVSLRRQLTENKSLSIQIEACNQEESLLEKSLLLTGLCLLPSVCGEEAENCEGTQYITQGIEVVSTTSGNATEIIIYGNLPSNLIKANSYIEKVTLVDVTSLPFRAFDALSGLVEVGGMENVISMDTGVFGGCTNLKFVKLNPGLTNIPSQAFLNCRNLETIALPEGITNIGAKAFEECRTLKNIDFQNCVSIGERAFYGCSALTNVVLPASLETIGQYAFYNCAELDVEEVSAAMKINKYAFCQDRGIKNLTVHSPFIDTYAFGYCINLKTLKIKEGTVLGTHCFYNCISLETVEFEGDTNTIPASCFSQCSKLNIPYITAAGSINSSAFSNTGLTETTIDCPVIGANAFERCSKLESLTLINTQEIGNYGFYMCSALEKIVFPDNTELTLGNSAFYSDRALKSVTVPRIKKFGAYAFAYCTGITNVTLGSKGYPVSSLPSNTFIGCTQENMTISVYVDDPSAPLAYEPWGATNAIIEYLQA